VTRVWLPASAVAAISRSLAPSVRPCRSSEGQHIEPRQDLVDTPGEPHRTTLGGAKAQFGGDNNAGQNISLAALADATRDRTLTVSHKVRDDVGVEQVSH